MDDKLFDLSDDDLIEEVADAPKVSKELGEEDKDFLKSLEKMAEEVEDEAGNPK